MKYGIITYHNIPNFGAVLQAYALTKAIQKEGYECEIIDYTCDNIVKRELEFHPSNNVVKSFLHRIFTWPHLKKKISMCQDFMKPLYSKYNYTKKTIETSCKSFDAFISGSDMIWNLDVNGYDYSYFIDFAPNKYHFSYGSSIGDKWNENDIEKIKSFLRNYSAISVREHDTAEYISSQLKMDCTVVCDPTMLLTYDDWDKLTFPIQDKNYVLVYFPSTRLINAARIYCKKKNKKLIILQKQLPFKNKESRMLYTPQEWISYIKYADAIFTNSYHGLLFSLYFKKQVWTDNKGNRIVSILDMLNIKKCFIDEDNELNNVIDYGSVSQRITLFRNDSMSYLKKALEGGI